MSTFARSYRHPWRSLHVSRKMALDLFEAIRRAPPWIRWLLVLVPLRVALIGLVPILPEEAYHWNFARHLDWGYFDHPPMIAWSIAAGRLFFGDTSFGIRAVPLLYSVGTSILLARAAKRCYGDSAAVWALILFTFMPVALTVSEAAFPDSPMLFFWTLTMTLAWNAIEGQDGRRWIPAGAALGAALLSKYTAIFLIPSVFLYLILSKRDRRWLATPWPHLGIVVAVVVFLPAIYWNWSHDWVSFLYQSKARLEEDQGTPGRPLRFLTNQALAYFPLTLPLVMATVVRLARTVRPEEQFLRACVVPIVLAFWAVSFKRPTHVLWPLPGYLALAVLMSGAAVEGTGAVARLYRQGRNGLLALSILGLLIAGIHLAFFVPWLSPLQGPYGWNEAAARARAVRATLPESAFYLALGRKYACTSQLAHHLNLPYDVHGANLIGRGALQYAYWSDPPSLKGRDAVIVIESQPRAAMYEPILKRYFDSVEAADEVVVPVGRAPMIPAPPLRFYLYHARGYRPPEPK